MAQADGTEVGRDPGDPGTAGLWGIVREAAERLEVEPGTTIMRQGEIGRAFWLVDRGAVDVVVGTTDGVRLPVARLGPGMHFGEMSLLTGAPASADVVACEQTVLFALSAEAFGELVRRSPELTAYLAGELARRLRTTNERLGAQEHARSTIEKLLAERSEPLFLADLPSFRGTLLKGVTEAATAEGPVLITGEAGVGKRALARYLHAAGSRAEGLCVVVDCRELDAATAATRLFGGVDADPLARFADRLGLLQAADRGTLILAHIECLPEDAQPQLARYLQDRRSSAGATSVDVRLIATSCCAPEALAQGGAVSTDLAGELARGQALALLPLHRRRRDIVPLAEHLLGAGATPEQPARRLSDSARRMLLAHDFRFGNVDELGQVLRLAARLTGDEVIRADHLFFGPPDASHVPQVDLFRWPGLARLLMARWFMPTVKLVVGLTFLGIILACLLLPAERVGRIANALTWGVWWPGLVVSLVLFGRAWCAVCPLVGGGELAQRLRGRGVSPPEWLVRVAPYLTMVGFAAILYIEGRFRLMEHPLGTGILLLSIGTVAVVLTWLLERHAWCRYLCPLGAMAAVLAVPSVLRVRAPRSVCGGSCQGNECYRGSATTRGCPMFIHAAYLSHGQYCKLCLECLRSCPTHSPRFTVQPPLVEIWRSELLSPELAPLGIVVGLLGVLVAVTSARAPAGLPVSTWLGVGTLAALVVGVGAARILHWRQRTAPEADVWWPVRVVYAFGPTAAAVLFSFHLQALPWLGRLQLQVGDVSGARFGLSALQLAQLLACALGASMTLWALKNLCAARFPHRAAPAVAAWLGLAAVVAATVALGSGLLR